MKKNGKIRQIVSAAFQFVLILGLFLLGGLLLPAYVAPYLAEVLPITTPQEAARQEMSVQIDNRNINVGESFSVGVSNPASAVRVGSLFYDCSNTEVSLGYASGDDIKVIPCDTRLELPERPRHEFRLLAAGSEATQLPIELRLQDGDRAGQLSFVLVTAARDADQQSDFLDTTTATLQSFPTQQ